MSTKNPTHTDIARHIESAWLEYLSLLQAKNRAINQLSDTLDKECGAGMGLFAYDDSDDKKEAREAATSVLYHLVYRAARVFTAPGCTPIDINPRTWEEGHLENLTTRSTWGEYREFSPVSLWSALERQYGGEKGEEATYSKAAREIVSRFNLHRQHEVKARAGCHILNASVWIDDFDKKHSNKTALSYASRDEIENLCKNLSTFSRWAGDEKQAIQIENARSNFSLTRGKFESRERRTLSDGIQVVCYLSRFEFLMRDALAEKLKVFVATYASGMFKEAA